MATLWAIRWKYSRNDRYEYVRAMTCMHGDIVVLCLKYHCLFDGIVALRQAATNLQSCAVKLKCADGVFALLIQLPHVY